ncbi:TIGR00341 family protein [Halobacteriales archaeon QS_1_68_20]|nr:MAG: TIGR00341 family protein [Halobacteriales archaeon QS_1_68_20]
MRPIQATVPTGALADVKAVLDERGTAYFATHETGTDEYEAVLYISIPEEAVESLLEALYETGLGSDDHVLIIDTEVDIFGRADGAETDEDGHARIASAELHGKTEDLIPDFRTFVTMMVLSTIVATTGVLLDSPAVVVGSMVLAPPFGPAASASVGTVIDEPEPFWYGVSRQALGVAIAVTAATAFAWVMKAAYLLPSGFALTAAPQVAERLSPDLLSLVVALVAGIAGVISIATASGRALVGVMMAAALLPPAAIVGIGFAWAEPTVALHSAVLLAVNLLAINFAGLVTCGTSGTARSPGSRSRGRGTRSSSAAGRYSSPSSSPPRSSGTSPTPTPSGRNWRTPSRRTSGTSSTPRLTRTSASWTCGSSRSRRR